MAVGNGRRTMGRPTRVRNGHLGHKRLGGVHLCLCDALTKAGDLSYFLEEEHLTGLVAVDANTGRVIATIFLACKAAAEDIANFFAVLIRTKSRDGQHPCSKKRT